MSRFTRSRPTMVVLAVLGMPVPLILFNREFAASSLERLELWGAVLASVLLAAGLGGLVWRLVGRHPTSGAWWLVVGWLTIVLGGIGWVVGGTSALVAALVAVALMGMFRVLQRRSSEAIETGLLVGVLAGVGFLCVMVVTYWRPPRPPPRQVVLIGLDAATWDIIDELRSVGRLPTFERLIHEGTRGELDTVFPVISPPLWTSIATGKTPEKHGIEDFWGGSDDVRTKRLWEIADERGLVSGVLGYLVTWPPRKQGGFLVPGWDAQGTETVPPDLGFLKRLEISAKQGAELPVIDRVLLVAAGLRHGVTLSTLNAALAGMFARWLGVQRPLDEALEGRLLKLYLTVDVFCHLLRTTQPTLPIYYYSSIDAIQHQYFKYYAPAGFPDLERESIALYRDAIPRVYEESDKALARILRSVAPGANVMIVSDHGQRAMRREGGKAYRIRTSKLLDALGIEGKVRATNMGTEVFLRPATSSADFTSAVAAIRSVVTVSDGRAVFSVHERPSGVALLEVSPQAAVGDSATARVGDHEMAAADLFDRTERISGEHTETAILLMVGPDVKVGQSIPRGSVLDVTPTMLTLLGLPVARDMDGKVLAGAFRPGVLDRMPESIETYGAVAAVPDHETTTVPQRNLEQLRALGYVE